MAATATFHVFRNRDENILLGLRKIFEVIKVTNGAPSFDISQSRYQRRATIDGLTVLSLFHEDVSIVSASHSRVVHESRTWLHFA